MKSCDRICWVSAVGDDPSLGGGVARAVNLIKSSGLIAESDGDFFSLYGMGKFRQIFFCVHLLFLGYRKFVVHSFFSPFVLFLLCLPMPITILIMPHGELKSGALSINYSKKIVARNTVGFFYLVNRWLKNIAAIASNEEELLLLDGLLPLKQSIKLPDFLSPKIFLSRNINFNKKKKVNLVLIARMVPNKGIADLLRSILLGLDSIENGLPASLGSIFIFYQEEDMNELLLVKELSRAIKSKSTIDFHLLAGHTPEKMARVLENIPNKIGFISSRFESFGYALIESLGFEYKPIVWFRNELVDMLLREDLCIKLKYGSIVNDNGKTLFQEANSFHCKKFLQEMAVKSFHSYKDIIDSVFRVKICKTNLEG